MDIIEVRDAGEWREWLTRNGRSADEVWLVLPHKGIPGVRYQEAVEQALCFGWIDGLHRKHDPGHSRLRFTPRRRRSSWSALNRARATRLTTAGLMTDAGQAAIDQAKATGAW
ncbi:MAG: hypothetical protein WBA97_01545 [Actinophytocola sp.]|uniref:YdeI/OmpD-associated family protein n=1 Tax=Actinophytocola sp. TaxID=1872138 RepID=UPI003C70630D